MPPGATFEMRKFANAGGARQYALYIPQSHARAPTGLLVMLHGCSQSAHDFAAGTRMNDVAEEHGFLVAYPEQTPAANASKCWNWFEEDHHRRDCGEAAVLAGITRDLMQKFAIGRDRVFIAGLSAGGAAAAVMGFEYPDLYSAIGVHSGLACGAARDLPSAFAAMKQGSATARRRRLPMRTIVFHGDQDATVSPINAAQVIAQSRGMERLTVATTQGRAPGGVRYTRTLHTTGDGRAMIEHWELHGAGHAWAGGSPAGSYTDPRGPDASREMVRFFLS
jgi:poly(hydroxyalkanoate) depolymerase family esterase